MKSIILNNCYGGYSWSLKGVREVLKRKGIKFRYMAVVYPEPGRPEKIEITESQFQYILEHRDKTRYCGPDGLYVSEVYFEGENDPDKDSPYYRGWNKYSIDREDPDAIAVFEEFGPVFCSGEHAKLYLDEYDDEDWVADIDEYDGMETLDLQPRLTEKRVRACKNIDEVVELLRRLCCFVNNQ